MRRQARYRMRRGWVTLALAMVVVASACGGEADPYGQLTDLEASYVIPFSGQWGLGDPCADADCVGDIDSDRLRDASWFVVAAIGVMDPGVEVTPDTEATVQVHLDVTGKVREQEQQATIEALAWAQDVAWAMEALAAGHELWAATECGVGTAPEYICHFVAIDNRDRFAGIGYGKGLLFTTPLAREAAHRGSLTGRQFLEDHI